MELFSLGADREANPTPIRVGFALCVRIIVMKKIIFAVVFIGIISIVSFVLKNSLSNEVILPDTSESNSAHPDPSNASFLFDDTEITLSAGKGERVISPDGAFTEEVALLDKFAYGDINADGKEDAALFLTRYGAGSGTFIYLAAFISGPITYRGSKAVFLGDRVSPISIAIDKNVITVEYLDRQDDEPMTTEPNIPVSKQFIFKNKSLEEK